MRQIDSNEARIIVRALRKQGLKVWQMMDRAGRHWLIVEGNTRPARPEEIKAVVGDVALMATEKGAMIEVAA